MRHVFVETNWVFEFCAPAHRSTPEAQALAARAASGDLVLHVPAVSLREGANAIRQKCKPSANKELRTFRLWAQALDPAVGFLLVVHRAARTVRRAGRMIGTSNASLSAAR
jgi:hypothetical protein